MDENFCDKPTTSSLCDLTTFQQEIAPWKYEPSTFFKLKDQPSIKVDSGKRFSENQPKKVMQNSRILPRKNKGAGISNPIQRRFYLQELSENGSKVREQKKFLEPHTKMTQCNFFQQDKEYKHTKWRPKTMLPYFCTRYYLQKQLMVERERAEGSRKAEKKKEKLPGIEKYNLYSKGRRKTEEEKYPR